MIDSKKFLVTHVISPTQVVDGIDQLAYLTFNSDGKAEKKQTIKNFARVLKDKLMEDP